jgi:DNA polymerase III delta subunit
MAGEEQWRLRGEITKLANYNPEITVESIEKMVVPGHNESIFDLVEAMSAGKQKEALSLYHDLLGQQINEIYILSMIIWQLRNLLLAKTAGDMPSAELAKQAGMSPFVASKMQTKQRHLSEAAIKQAFLEAVETDYQIKTGQGAADVLVERLILRVAGGIKTGS